MSRVDRLKTMREELLRQKDVIEHAGGVVSVANSHPTMTEITAGIQTLSNVDFAAATATEEDVAVGKTFYAGDSVLKTGTALIDAKQIQTLFMYNQSTVSNEDEVYYTIPSSIQTLKKYTFYQNSNHINITFSDGIKIIDDYSFYETTNAQFYGFGDLTTLKQVSLYAFTRSQGKGLDVARLPDCIEMIYSGSFAYVKPESLDYRLPANLTSMGQSAFRQNYRQEVNSLDLSNAKVTTLSAYAFHSVGFNCDLVIPNNVRTIGSYFNQNGSFNNITIPSTCTTLEQECFGAYTTHPISDYRLKTVTFESETPPNFGSKVFAAQNISNGFKIYVPDTAVDVYKAVTSLAYCASCIYPVSQKP